MRRPKSIKVLGQKYKILYDYTDEENLGLTVEETSTIHVRGGLQEDKIIKVLMHEVTHAILMETPYSLRRRFDVEEVCDIVGYFLVAVLKANPDVVQYILSETEEKVEE